MEEKRVMTPEEFAAKMREILVGVDLEDEHVEADNLMCRVLRDLGYTEGVTVFLQADMWYA
jgi:hypothetical protein